MKRPKNGTKMCLTVVDQGLEVTINGRGDDIAVVIVAAMENDERLEEILLTAMEMFTNRKEPEFQDLTDKAFEGVDLQAILDATRKEMVEADIMPEFGDFLRAVMSNVKKAQGKGDEKKYDFSGVEDLLTKDEKTQL